MAKTRLVKLIKKSQAILYKQLGKLVLLNLLKGKKFILLPFQNYHSRLVPVQHKVVSAQKTEENKHHTDLQVGQKKDFGNYRPVTQPYQPYQLNFWDGDEVNPSVASCSYKETTRLGAARVDLSRASLASLTWLPLQ